MLAAFLDHGGDVFAVEKRKREGDGAVSARGGLERCAEGAGGEGEDGGAVAAVVGAGDDEVDWPFSRVGFRGREKVAEGELGAGCWGGVD